MRGTAQGAPARATSTRSTTRKRDVRVARSSGFLPVLLALQSLFGARAGGSWQRLAMALVASLFVSMGGMSVADATPGAATPTAGAAAHAPVRPGAEPVAGGTTGCDRGSAGAKLCADGSAVAESGSVTPPNLKCAEVEAEADDEVAWDALAPRSATSFVARPGASARAFATQTHDSRLDPSALSARGPPGLN